MAKEPKTIAIDLDRNLQSLDISESAELLDLAEDVQRSGVLRLLLRGELELALVVPLSRAARAPGVSEPVQAHDALLNIIGIGASEEPTDFARQEDDYLAEAFVPALQ